MLDRVCKQKITQLVLLAQARGIRLLPKGKTRKNSNNIFMRNLLEKKKCKEMK